MSWTEVATAKAQSRHELVLSGADISKRIEECKGLDPDLYKLTNLNYLCVSETCLSLVSPSLANLKNLTTLVLHTNKLTEIPNCVGFLEKLKLLDVSRNSITQLPNEISQLANLSQLNVSLNQIKELPSFKNNTKLSLLDVSDNELDQFPDVIHPELVHLAELKMKGNKISTIPWNAASLPSLKLLDLTDNLVDIVPGELADNSKLKGRLILYHNFHLTN